MRIYCYRRLSLLVRRYKKGTCYDSIGYRIWLCALCARWAHCSLTCLYTFWMVVVASRHGHRTTSNVAHTHTLLALLFSHSFRFCCALCAVWCMRAVREHRMLCSLPETHKLRQLFRSLFFSWMRIANAKWCCVQELKLPYLFPSQFLMPIVGDCIQTRSRLGKEMKESLKITSNCVQHTGSHMFFDLFIHALLNAHASCDIADSDQIIWLYPRSRSSKKTVKVWYRFDLLHTEIQRKRERAREPLRAHTGLGRHVSAQWQHIQANCSQHFSLTSNVWCIAWGVLKWAVAVVLHIWFSCSIKLSESFYRAHTMLLFRLVSIHNITTSISISLSASLGSLTQPVSLCPRILASATKHVHPNIGAWMRVKCSNPVFLQLPFKLFAIVSQLCKISYFDYCPISSRWAICSCNICVCSLPNPLHPPRSLWRLLVLINISSTKCLHVNCIWLNIDQRFIARKFSLVPWQSTFVVAFNLTRKVNQFSFLLGAFEENAQH